MPTNFTKTLDTVAPAITVNELSYDTSAGDAARSVAGALNSYAELRAEQEKNALAGEFSTELDLALEAELSLQDDIDMERAALAAAHKQGLRALEAKGASEEEVKRVEARFYQELDTLDLREQQKGIQLNANRRALIRRYKANYPHMAAEFEQALDSNRKLAEVRERSESSRQDPLDKVNERMAMAVSIGSTPEALNFHDAIVRDAAALTARVQAMSDRGEINRYAWQQTINEAGDLGFQEAVVNLVPRIQRVASTGQGLTELRTDITAAKDNALYGLVMAKQKIEMDSEAKGNPIRLDIRPEQERVAAAFDALMKIVTTDDLRNMAEIGRLVRDERRLRFLAGIYSVPLEVADAMAPQFVKDVNTWFEATERLKNMSLTEMTAGGAWQADEAGQTMNSLSVMLGWRGESLFDPRYLTGDEEQKKAFWVAMTAIRRRLPVPDDIAAKAAPVLQAYFNRSYKTADNTPDKDAAASASLGLVEQQLDPSKPVSGYYAGDAGNRGSQSSQIGVENPRLEDEMHTRRTQAIMGDYLDTYNSDILKQIKFDPKTQAGFSYGNSARAEFQGVDALQRLYQRRKNTLGQESADEWATGIMAYIQSRITATSDTSNQPPRKVYNPETGAFE